MFSASLSSEETSLFERLSTWAQLFESRLIFFSLRVKTKSLRSFDPSTEISCSLKNRFKSEEKVFVCFLSLLLCSNIQIIPTLRFTPSFQEWISMKTCQVSSPIIEHVFHVSLKLKTKHQQGILAVEEGCIQEITIRLRFQTVLFPLDH